MAIYYVGFPLLLITAVLDATFMSLFRIWGGAPNLVLMVVVSWALLTELDEALPWAVMGGIMRDLLSVAPTGSSALALVIIVVVIDRLLPKLSWRNVGVPPLTVFVATFVYNGVLFGTLALAGWPTPFFWGILYVMLPGAVMNFLAVLLVFRSMGAVNSLLRPQRASLLR
jgi:rod shape-determining protein MreD